MTEIIVVITITCMWAIVLRGPSEMVKKFVCCFLLSVVVSRMVTQAVSSLVNRHQSGGR